jgi:hypothetical protein
MSLQSEFYQLNNCCYLSSSVCLFAGSSQLKMPVTEQRENIKCRVLLFRSPPERLRVPEEVHGEAEVKKEEVCG